MDISMKRVLSLLLGLLMIFSLVGCSDEKTDDTNETIDTAPITYRNPTTLSIQMINDTVVNKHDFTELKIGIGRECQYYDWNATTAKLIIEAEYFDIVTEDGRVFSGRYEQDCDINDLKYFYFINPDGEKELRSYESFYLRNHALNGGTFVTGEITVTLESEFTNGEKRTHSRTVFYAIGSHIAFSSKSENDAGLMIKEYNENK